MSAVRARGSACTSVPSFWDSLGGTFLHLCDLVLSLIPQLYPISSMTLYCLPGGDDDFCGFVNWVLRDLGSTRLIVGLLCHLSQCLHLDSNLVRDGCRVCHHKLKVEYCSIILCFCIIYKVKMIIGIPGQMLQGCITGLQ